MSMIRLRMKLRRDKSTVAKASTFAKVSTFAKASVDRMADRLGYCEKPILTLILRNTEKLQ